MPSPLVTLCSSSATRAVTRTPSLSPGPSRGQWAVTGGPLTSESRPKRQSPHCHCPGLGPCGHRPGQAAAPTPRRRAGVPGHKAGD